MKETMPTYAITLAKLDAKGKTIFHTSAGANNLDQFSKTDLMNFIEHFKEQMAVIEGKK